MKNPSGFPALEVIAWVFYGGLVGLALALLPGAVGGFWLSITVGWGSGLALGVMWLMTRTSREVVPNAAGSIRGLLVIRSARALALLSFVYVLVAITMAGLAAGNALSYLLVGLVVGTASAVAWLLLWLLLRDSLTRKGFRW